MYRPMLCFKCHLTFTLELRVFLIRFCFLSVKFAGHFEIFIFPWHAMQWEKSFRDIIFDSFLRGHWTRDATPAYTLTLHMQTYWYSLHSKYSENTRRIIRWTPCLTHTNHLFDVSSRFHLWTSILCQKQLLAGPYFMAFCGKTCIKKNIGIYRHAANSG